MGEVALRRWQAALESARGTDLPATRRVYASGHMMKAIDLIEPNEDRGTFINNYRSSQGVVKAEIPLTGGVSYEDIAWWFELALKGGVVGVVRGVTAYDYTFVPTPATDDLKSATFEFGDDTQAYHSNYCMVDTMEITGALNSFWSFKVGLIGTDMVTDTFTGALSDRTVEDVNTYLTKLAVGAAGAVPSSYMTGRFIGFTLSINNNLSRKYFADGVAPTLGGMGRGKREYNLETTFEGNAATITERGVWEAGTNRVARITATGSAIAGSTGPIYRTVDIVFPGKWQAFQISERDTNTTFVAKMRNEYDATLTYDLSAVVTNGLVTLP
jgi:hypothetical protein